LPFKNEYIARNCLLFQYCISVHAQVNSLGWNMCSYVIELHTKSQSINGKSCTVMCCSSFLCFSNNFILVILLVVAFLFNWIGFLLLMCFCHTIAARYGALSGFGLSLAKWTLIVKHSTDFGAHENGWLWWLVMAFGNIPSLKLV